MSARYGETVILAAGDFPRKGGKAWNLLVKADRVIACDSAADAYRRRFRRWPTVVIGDLDSLKSCGKVMRRRLDAAGKPPVVIRVPEQDTNDLAKAVRYCAAQGWRNPVVLGATGRREDHTLGNVFRALDFGLEVVSDYGRFVPVEGKATFRLAKGSPVSVFASDPATRMTSRGLEWPLDGVVFENLYCATLNRASAATVTLTATKRVYIYFAS